MQWLVTEDLLSKTFVERQVVAVTQLPKGYVQC